ncbi:MAG: lytic transglycosylase domain-containing protein [Solirubrobacterales bacterium]
MAARSARPARGRSVLRRRLFGFVFVIVIVGAIGFVVAHTLEKGYRELALPLRHDDIIRQQARQKNLDPALIAAVIYQESRFRPRESDAGAQGLMQILPATADFIANRSGGTKFTTKDLATPQVNISYGAYYLRYLIDRYDGDVLTALAAYNAGEGRVDEWLKQSGNSGGTIKDAEEIPFPETREYVKNVLKARDQYKREYARELSV